VRQDLEALWSLHFIAASQLRGAGTWSAATRQLLLWPGRYRVGSRLRVRSFELFETLAW